MTESYARNTIKYNDHLRIDVPVGYEDLTAYRATLGHKANHQFVFNGYYEFYYNPRLDEAQSKHSTL